MNNKLVRFKLTNINIFIIYIEFGFTNIDTIHILTRNDPITTPNIYPNLPENSKRKKDTREDHFQHLTKSAEFEVIINEYVSLCQKTGKAKENGMQINIFQY